MLRVNDTKKWNIPMKEKLLWQDNSFSSEQKMATDIAKNEKNKLRWLGIPNPIGIQNLTASWSDSKSDDEIGFRINNNVD